MLVEKNPHKCPYSFSQPLETPSLCPKHGCSQWPKNPFTHAFPSRLCPSKANNNQYHQRIWELHPSYESRSATHARIQAVQIVPHKHSFRYGHNFIHFPTTLDHSCVFTREWKNPRPKLLKSGEFSSYFSVAMSKPSEVHSLWMATCIEALRWDFTLPLRIITDGLVCSYSLPIAGNTFLIIKPFQVSPSTAKGRNTHWSILVPSLNDCSLPKRPDPYKTVKESLPWPLMWIDHSSREYHFCDEQLVLGPGCPSSSSPHLVVSLLSMETFCLCTNYHFHKHHIFQFTFEICCKKPSIDWI